MVSYPPRGRPRRARVRSTQTAATETEAPTPTPSLVPQRPLHAWIAVVVLLFTMACVGLLLDYSLLLFYDASLQARVAYVLIIAGALAVNIVYIISLVVYVMPAALGMRRA